MRGINQNVDLQSSQEDITFGNALYHSALNVFSSQLI